MAPDANRARLTGSVIDPRQGGGENILGREEVTSRDIGVGQRTSSRKCPNRPAGSVHCRRGAHPAALAKPSNRSGVYL